MMSIRLKIADKNKEIELDLRKDTCTNVKILRERGIKIKQLDISQKHFMKKSILNMVKEANVKDNEVAHIRCTEEKEVEIIANSLFELQRSPNLTDHLTIAINRMNEEQRANSKIDIGDGYANIFEKMIELNILMDENIRIMNVNDFNIMMPIQLSELICFRNLGLRTTTMIEEN